MSSWSRIVLVGLWIATTASVAVDVVASCSAVFETAELSLMSVTVDGEDLDPELHVEGYDAVFIGGAFRGVWLWSDRYDEWFTPEGQI